MKVKLMSWNEVFLRGFNLWIKSYTSGLKKYYECEGDLVISLMLYFHEAALEKGLSGWRNGIVQEKKIIGYNRVDLMLGDEVAFEVKFEPDYPDMPRTRKPVTNTVLKRPDRIISKYAGLTDEESQMRLYEIELDFIKLMAYKQKGIPYNYLLCLDEDGRLYRTLANSFRTQKIQKISIPWKSIRRGIDGQKVYYFLWQA